MSGNMSGKIVVLVPEVLDSGFEIQKLKQSVKLQPKVSTNPSLNN